MRLAVLASLTLACLFAAPAGADESVQFTLGRVVHTLPDAHNRIGIRSTCAEPNGCKVNYTLLHGTRLLGGTQALLLGNTVQTDYVNLTKATAATLRKRRWVVTIKADASDPDGNAMTVTKNVTLGPKKTSRR